jgi:putative redox protein
MQIREKTFVQMKLSGKAVHHARTDVSVRDKQVVIDEPLARNGTDLGLTPTETLGSALMGCLNVIGHRIAHKLGITIHSLEMELDMDFDRRGVTLAEEVEIPFPTMTVRLRIETDADDSQVSELRKQLAQYCALSKIIRASGTDLREEWIHTRRQA